MLSLLSSWFIMCSISLKNITLNAGILLCPINFLLANFITEVYGYKNSRRAIWCGFFFNILSVFYTLFIINLSSPLYAVHNTLFNLILVDYLKTSIMYMLSYLMTAPFNIFLLATLKLKLNGKHLKFRLLVCVMLTAFINGLILHLSEYHGSIINAHFISSLFISALLTLICLPVITFCIEKVKKVEKLDIYDQNTQFNFFKFEVKYILNNNRFDQFPR
ncbi:VUT family protein [Rickettsiella endosymbiont of Xylota segnis]|uniref:VUT family protein n=1 Tax=Rickettsiella endosymbiont of Xylota segnis TaxID=3066238 RepID=UPI003BB13061